jgi:hypothetical protein
MPNTTVLYYASAKLYVTLLHSAFALPCCTTLCPAYASQHLTSLRFTFALPYSAPPCFAYASHAATSLRFAFALHCITMLFLHTTMLHIAFALLNITSHYYALPLHRETTPDSTLPLQHYTLNSLFNASRYLTMLILC